MICKCLSLSWQCQYHLFGSSFKEYTIVTNKQKISTSKNIQQAWEKNFLLGTRRHPASQPVDQAFLVLPWFFGSDLNQEEICKYQIVKSSQLHYSFCISTWHFIPKTAFNARHKFHFKAFSPQIIYHFINSSLARVSETWTSTYIKHHNANMSIMLRSPS